MQVKKFSFSQAGFCQAAIILFSFSQAGLCQAANSQFDSRFPRRDCQAALYSRPGGLSQAAVRVTGLSLGHLILGPLVKIVTSIFSFTLRIK